MIAALSTLAIAIVTGAASGLVAWGAMRAEVRFLWRDLSRLETRVNVLSARISDQERSTTRYRNAPTL